MDVFVGVFPDDITMGADMLNKRRKVSGGGGQGASNAVVLGDDVVGDFITVTCLWTLGNEAADISQGRQSRETIASGN